MKKKIGGENLFFASIEWISGLFLQIKKLSERRDQAIFILCKNVGVKIIFNINKNKEIYLFPSFNELTIINYLKAKSNIMETN